MVSAHDYGAARHGCTLCGKAFSARSLVGRHALLEHGLGRRYPCEHCPKVFSDPSNLQRHIRVRHLDRLFQTMISRFGFRRERDRLLVTPSIDVLRNRVLFFFFGSMKETQLVI